jgi:hypothetical protein
LGRRGDLVGDLLQALVGDATDIDEGDRSVTLETERADRTASGPSLLHFDHGALEVA